MMKVNLNDSVKVKLTPKGADIYYHQYDELIKEYPKMEKHFQRKMPQIDKDGYTTLQLWRFMELYGSYMMVGCDLPCDTNILIEVGDLDANKQE